jgi:hypothetical protein
MTSVPPEEIMAITEDLPPRFEFIIKTFTARYLPVEDRIRLDCVDIEGAQQSVLITRRLADKVIPLISTQLEQKIPEGFPKDIAQDMRQEQARQQRNSEGAECPVVPKEKSPEWLCITLQIKKREQGDFILIFTDDRTINASMGMTEETFRVVLDILFDMYTAADWGAGSFPGWYERGLTEPKTSIKLN